MVTQSLASANLQERLLDLIVNLRNRHFFIIDAVALSLTPLAALALRLDGLEAIRVHSSILLFFTGISLVIKLLIFHRFLLYDRYWRYAYSNDTKQAFLAVSLATLIIAIGFIGAYPILQSYGLAMYRTVPIIDGLLTGVVILGGRLGYREICRRHDKQREARGGRRILIVGAGAAGTMAAREMLANPHLLMEPIGFADDDPAKVGTVLLGLPVVGPIKDIPSFIGRSQAQAFIIALPSLPLPRRNEIISLCQSTGLPVDNVPGIYEILAGSKTISRLPKVDINRLLRREPITIDESEIGSFLSQATVLVTGAGGSIGSELCRQIARFHPKELIILGHGENSIFEINLDLNLSFPNLQVTPLIADIRNQERIDNLIQKHHPSIIFHAAAHKHVPLMEGNIEEAITNNVIGTKNVVCAAEKYGVSHFVLISTDKAINPKSIMGTTKRLAELLVLRTARQSGRPYMAVRFGNVLGSRGSVIPVFLRQISAGGPVTVTHPDMTRYFMSIPEAVQLVLQASILGKGGEIFMLDMGDPVKIMDLATDLIRLAGLQPERDIQIKFSGIRPGEKMMEDIFSAAEHYERTKHHKIFSSTNDDYAEAETVARLVNLEEEIRTYSGKRDPGEAMAVPRPERSK